MITNSFLVLENIGLSMALRLFSREFVPDPFEEVFEVKFFLIDAGLELSFFKKLKFVFIAKIYCYNLI